MNHAPGAATRVTRCRSCSSESLITVLDLGPQPACDHFPPVEAPLPDPVWPLALVMCADCALVQLDHRSPAPEEPLAVESATLKRHAVEVSGRLCDRLGLTSGTSVREFASHHGGSWLEALGQAGCVPVSTGPADVVIDNQSLIHEEDLDREFARRVEALSAGGALVIEFHHALAQLESAQFDTVRHGHPLYFSLTSWTNLCARHGLTVTDAWEENVFGGCLVAVAVKGLAASTPWVGEILERERAAGAHDPRRFARLDAVMRRTVADFLEHVESAARAGRRLAAYGAGSKAVTFLGVAGQGCAGLGMVADLSPAKHGRRIPGVGLVIVSPEELVADAPDEVVILTWDIADEVIEQLQEAGLRKADFVVPMPSLRTLRHGSDH